MMEKFIKLNDEEQIKRITRLMTVRENTRKVLE